MAEKSFFQMSGEAPEIDDAKLQGQRVRFMYRNSIFGTLATTLVALITALYFWLNAGSQGALIWLFYFIIVGIGRVVVYKTYQKADDVETSPENWIMASTITMAASGVGWGGGALFFFNTDAPYGSFVVTAVVVAMLVSGVLLLASFTRVLLAFAIPAAIPMLAMLGLGGHPAYWAAAAMLVVVLVTMFLNAMRMQEGLKESLKLAHDNSHLLEVMSRSKQQLEKLNQELSQEVNNRTNVQDELKRAKIEAEAAVLSKDEFLATMSHEIRTPMNGILPILDILRGTKLDESQKDYLNTAFASSKHLLSIIDDILDYSKIEAGKLDLEIVGLNLRELLDSVSRLMGGGAGKKGLELKTVIEPGVRLAARGDPVRLRQVLTNLVSNAIKFTEKGEVSVSVAKRSERRDKVELLFTVRDTGIGMSQEAQDKLFKPFSQAETSTTRNYGGTGLGLTICKRLVDLMDGKIGVKSQQGRGSAFWFTAWLMKSVGDIQAGAKDLSGSTALVISPSPDYMNRLKIFFDSWGMKHVPCNNLRDAIKHIKAGARETDWPFDCIIIDVKQMGKNAIELTQKLRQNKRLDSIGLMLLTDNGDIPPTLASLKDVAGCPYNCSQSSLNDGLETLLSGGSTAVSDEEIERSSSYVTAAEDHVHEAFDGKVLLVEDNPVNLHVAQKLLGVVGVEYEVSKNGKEALQNLMQRNYDVVLMDCMMPVMDGYTATREWRKYELQHSRPRLPIVAMTANAMAGDRQKCLDAGMDDYMSKPLNRHLIDQMLRRWVEEGRKAKAAKDPGASVSVSGTPSTNPAAAAQPTAPPPAGRKVLDKQILDDLMDIMGDEFGQLVSVYLEDSPKALSRLQEAARDNDLKGLLDPAHSLKSTSANLGAIDLSEMARDIEQNARLGKTDGAVDTVKRMLQMYKRVASELSGFRQ